MVAVNRMRLGRFELGRKRGRDEKGDGGNSVGLFPLSPFSHVDQVFFLRLLFPPLGDDLPSTLKQMGPGARWASAERSRRSESVLGDHFSGEHLDNLTETFQESLG